jgi:hypothetical protein
VSGRVGIPSDLISTPSASNLNYRVITAVRRIPFLGELASVGVGEPNRWMVVGQLSSLALILFVADASLKAKGSSRRPRRHL